MAVRGTGHVGSHSQVLSLPPLVGPRREAGKGGQRRRVRYACVWRWVCFEGRTTGSPVEEGVSSVHIHYLHHHLQSHTSQQKVIPMLGHDKDYFSTSVHTITQCHACKKQGKTMAWPITLLPNAMHARSRVKPWHGPSHYYPMPCMQEAG